MTPIWRPFGLAGLAATAVYLLDVSPVVNDACLLAIGAGTIAACFAGPLRTGAQPRAAWRLIGLGATLFLVGVLIRPIVTDAGLPLDAGQVAPEAKVHAASVGLGKGVADLVVEAAQQLVAPVQQGGAAAECREHAGELHRDVAAADHQDAFR